MTTATILLQGSSNHQDVHLEIDRRSTFKKIVDKVTAIFWEILETIKHAFLKFFSLSHFYDQFSVEKSDHKGLFVMVHGLFSHPSCWKYHLPYIDQKEFDVCTPFVPYEGNCSLEEAVEPIYEEKIEPYLRNNPQVKAVALIGHSNGGRIVHTLNLRIARDFPDVAVNVSSIAGAHFGSHVSSFFNCLKVYKYLPFFRPSMVEGLSYGSVEAQTLLTSMRTPLPNRVYTFYGAREDDLVPLDSALPDLGKNEMRIYKTGVAHISIIPVIAQEQMKQCIEWMRHISIAA